MKRLLTSTTALSVALATFPTMPVSAQTTTQIEVNGQIVICLPNKAVECPDGSFCVVAKNPANCEKNAIKALQLIADKAAAAAATDPTAETKAAADAAAAALAAAEADAAAAAQADADAAAAEKADADAAAAAQADADAAAAAQADADAAVAAQADADAAAAAQADADAAAAAQAGADEKAAAQAAADAIAAAQADADAAAAAQAAADAAAAAVVDADAVAKAQAEVDALIAAQAKTDAAAALQTQADIDAMAQAKADAKAAAKAKVQAKQAAKAAARAAAEQAALDAAAAAVVDPIVVPVPTSEEVNSLNDALAAGKDPSVKAPKVDADVNVVVNDGTLPSDVAPSADAKVTIEVVTATDARGSDQEFTAAPVTVKDGKKSGLTDLEKVGLIALSALVVGMILKDGNKVVSNTGDRVVVLQPDGTYVVYKDDDVLLRQPGSTVRTETYRDGSTRTVVTRTDGTQIVTIRDASGRVLRRAAYDKFGHEVMLIDDMAPEVRVDVGALPVPPREPVRISASDTDIALQLRMAELEAAKIGRNFSLRQIRDIPQVRVLAATIDVEAITFDSGSAAIKGTEAEKLAELGGLITDMIAANPGEVFLIEGHTDAVGSASSNLSLSDRRAESVAKALTEYFDVPPENLVVQGYGESDLRVNTPGDERANRRAAVRIITPLLRSASLQ